jgi:magnesium transporter
MTFQKRLPPVGSRPGTLAIPPDSPPPRIHLFDYQGDVCRELEINDPQELAPYVHSTRVTWVDIQGFGSESTLRAVAELFSLHPLTLADATNVPQRAKSEIRPEHHVIVARAPDPSQRDRVEAPQAFLLLGPSYLLTFQDRHFGFFDPVRDRLREGIGPIRRLGADYLAYALLSAMVDHYFPVLENFSEDIEELEDRVHGEAPPEVLEDLHRVRRGLVVMRRVGWPQREALRALVTEPSPFVSEEVQGYLRSAEQHMTQLMEAVDSARETTTGLVDLYLSNVSQRTNEIMKVLTLMASVFIPLTFVAGIYGMNFENMPELREPRGYYTVLTAMALIAGTLVAYFFRRGWLGSGGRRRKRRKSNDA